MEQRKGGRVWTEVEEWRKGMEQSKVGKVWCRGKKEGCGVEEKRKGMQCFPQDFTKTKGWLLLNPK